VRFENEVSVRAPVTRLRLWWNDAFWVIPLTGLVVALAVDAVVDNADEAFADSIDDFALLSPSSAATLFASVGGGMVTFTGFVFSVVLLIIQFGSSSYSPRTVAYFLRSRVTQSVLAVFVGTIAYAFLALISIGSAGRDTYVPFFGVFVCLLFLAASLVAFLVLIQHVAGRIRVDALLTNLGTLARRAIARDLVGGGPEKASVLDDVPTLDSAATTVRHRGKSGQIVAIDTHLAQRLAAATGVEVIFDVRVGDGISPGTPVASVRAATSDERFNRCVLVHRERSLEYDPLYALRILTDVGLRALSPAINDPTTAVRALDEAEAVLRVAAPLNLGPVRIRAGAGSVVVPGPTWTDIVDLAIWEVLEAGLEAPQITRRLSALLGDLLADLPTDRHPPLLRYLHRLRSAVTASIDPRDAGRWLTGDRQGLGGSRPGSALDGPVRLTVPGEDLADRHDQ
jgi:uncharacterized membrane protein